MDDYPNAAAQRQAQPLEMTDDGMAVQGYAFGGIANPIQRPFLRGVDKSFLSERQKELDAFEQQRLAYNAALEDWQTNVYQPYQQQANAYNAAVQKYNEEVYQPYEEQYSAYEKAVNEWNAGSRESDYAGPAAPTLSRTFDMTAPTVPGDFSMTAPSLPFKEEDVKKYQQESAERARKDAANRAVAIDVVSDPDRFNFGSMSVAGRFMAEGGPVDKNAPTSRQLLDELTPEIARSLMHRSMTTGAPTAEFNRYGGYDAVRNLYNQSGGTYSREEISREDMQNYANIVARTGVGNLAILADTNTPITPQALENMRRNGIDEGTIAAAAITYSPRALSKKPPGTTVGGLSMPSLSGASSSPVAAYGGVKPLDMTEFFKSMPTANWGTSSGTRPTDQGTSGGGGGQGSQGSGTSNPTGGNVGQVGGIGTAINITGPAMPYIGAVGPIGTASQQLRAIAPGNFFAQTPTTPGLTPGTTGLPYVPAAQYQGPSPLAALAASPNLSPGMLGGIQNAGAMVDRLGNRIYSPGALPGLARGGDVDVAALLAKNTETLSDEEPEERIDSNPVGTAQKYLEDLSNLGQERTSYEVSPTKKTIKRTRVAPTGDGKSSKGMMMEYESLTQGEIGGKAPKSRDTDSARSQLEDLVRQYGIKASVAKNKARGLAADTFGAPTLEGPTLTKNTLAKKRFKDGGEAKKSEVEESEPGLLDVSKYATRAAERMFPDQKGQDDQRDAARHMLAAAMVAKKTSPGVAEFLGKAHERLSNPKSFFSMFGIGDPRYDYDVDVHNNRLGAELAARTKSQQELEALVRQMALQSQNKQVPGKPWTMTREQLEAVDAKNKKAATPPEYRADGSPEEGEVSDAELKAASRPAFVTPKSGRGRKEGPISRALNSGEAYSAMVQGAADLPYNLVGAPVDIATMLMRPLGYNVDKPVMSSDWIKEKMTNAGVRPATPTDSTQKGFHTAGELLAGLVNPAGATRTGVRTVQRAGQAASDVAKDFQQYNRQLTVPGASYAVRPEGSSLVIRRDQNPDWVGQLLDDGVRSARDQLANMTHSTDRASLMESFWNNKAANYFSKQFGTESDPVYRGIRDQTIKSPILGKDFPDYVLDQLPVGKTRVNAETGESRFFPKYPAAYDAMRKRYDDLTQIRGAVPVRDPSQVMSPDFTYGTSRQGDEFMESLRNQEIDKMIAQGTPVSQASPTLEFLTRSVQKPETTLGPYNAKSILTDYEAATGTRLGDPGFQSVAQPGLLPQNLQTAFEKGEIMYGTGGPNAPLRQLFDTRSINEYLAGIPERELKNIRFEDAVKGGAKVSAKRLERETLAADIRAGKRVPDKFFSEGVSAPLVQFQEGPLAGFAWKRIEKADATVPEGAYVGHSVGGYAQGGAYGPERHKQFNEGVMRIYTLRDTRNRPVNTIEVRMDDTGPIVTQIKGNGRATGNIAPEKYDQAVMQFLQDYLKPVRINESDNYLTPILQSYKEALRSTPTQP
jgi:hypothetical protein